MGNYYNNSSAFERLIEFIGKQGFYHPRDQKVSNQLGIELLRDLFSVSESLKNDALSQKVCHVLNHGFRRTIDTKPRTVDLVIGGLKNPEDSHQDVFSTKPEDLILKVNKSEFDSIANPRIIVEHKSVVTAHRNRGNRSDELISVRNVVNEACPNAILVATILIGTAREVVTKERIDRVIDTLDAFCSDIKESHSLTSFRKEIINNAPWRHRLLDDKKKYKMLVSVNSESDPLMTLEHMENVLSLRDDPNEQGYDAIIIEFCFIDNIHAPKLEQPFYFQNKKYSRFTYSNAIKKITELYDERFGKI